MGSYGDFSIYFIIYMATMLVFGSRWSMGVLHYLIFDILTIVNVGIDTKTKSLGSLTRNIYVIE